MESKDELHEIDTKNYVLLFWWYKKRNIYSLDILLDEKSYETYENILIYNISYKTSIFPKPLY